MAETHKNNVRIFGSGQKIIVFAHGYGCDQQAWQAVAPAFAHDYRIVLFDLMGCGGSDLSQYDDQKYATLDGYAQDVLDICRDFDLKNIVYVGHSVAAMIGILAAIKAPLLFEKLVLIGASPCHLNDGTYLGGFCKSDAEDLLAVMNDDFRGWAAQMAPVLMGNPERPELSAMLAESFRRNDPDIAKKFAWTIFSSDYRTLLPQLHVPSLIMQCAMDAIAPPTVGDYLCRKLPNSQLVLLQSTGHYPHLSAPEEIIECIQAFLDTNPTLNSAAAGMHEKGLSAQRPTF